jgi:hypothetical protein
MRSGVTGVVFAEPSEAGVEAAVAAIINLDMDWGLTDRECRCPSIVRANQPCKSPLENSSGFFFIQVFIQDGWGAPGLDFETWEKFVFIQDGWGAPGLDFETWEKFKWSEN